MKSDNRTQKSIKKKRRRKKHYLLRFLLFIALCVGVYFLLHIEYFNVDGITVAGNKEISDSEVIKLAEIETGENIFDIHPLFVEKRIKKNLYIETVDVKRKLPNKIEILVTERSGKAQFVSGKKFIITDNDGMVLEIANEEKMATIVDNVTVKDADVGKTIKVKEETIYNKAMDMIMLAEQGDMYFKKIVLQGKKADAYVYDGLVCRGEYSDIMDCLESGAIRAVVFDLYQKDIYSGTIIVGRNNYCSFTQ